MMCSCVSEEMILAVVLLAIWMDFCVIKGQFVLPIFYEINPSVVCKQKRKFGKALVKHEQEFDMNKVQIWRVALEKAGKLCGRHYKKGYVFNDYFVISD